MSNLGIVMLSVFVGVFIVILLISLGVAIFAAWKVWSEAREMRSRLAILLGEFDEHSNRATLRQKEVLDENTQSMRRLVEEVGQQAVSAKNSLSGVRQEMKSLLEGHQAIIAGAVKSINADGLEVASIKIINACKRMEQAVGTLSKLVYDRDVAEETSLASEEVAPSGASIYNRSIATSQDEELEVEIER